MFTITRQLDEWVTLVTIKELFENSQESTDLQALIMMLVFEKQVVNMEDDVSKLRVFFLDKHNTRMNEELKKYKQKMNISYKPCVFEAESDDRNIFIHAHSLTQANLKAEQVLAPVKDIKALTSDYMVNYKGSDVKVINLAKGKETPYIIGGY